MTERIGINLLTCNAAGSPLHLRAAQYAVRSLLASDVQRYDWRLQIVDNGSDCPATHEWLDELQGNVRVAVHRLGANVGIGKGRNVGWELLSDWRPDFGVEIHTDHIFPATWLVPLVAWTQQHLRIGMCGCALVTQGHAWGSPQVEISYDWPYEHCWNEVEKATRLHRRRGHMTEGLSHPAVYPWGALQEMGFYDGAMPGLQELEDTELAYRLTKAGWLVVIYHGSYVWHHYHFSRLVLDDWATSYDANNLYCQTKHGPEFIKFATTTVGNWMDKAYKR